MTEASPLPIVIYGAGLALHSPATSATEIPELLTAALDELFDAPTPAALGTYKIFVAIPDRERPAGERNECVPTFFGLLEHSIANRLRAASVSFMEFYGDYAGVRAVELAIVEMDKNLTLDGVLLLAADCCLTASPRPIANVGAAVLLTRTAPPAMDTRVLAIRNIVGSVVGDAVEGFSRAIKRAGWALSIDVDGVQHAVAATPPHGLSEGDLRLAASRACPSGKYTGTVHKPSADNGSFGAATGVYDLAFAGQLLRTADPGTHCLWVARTSDAALAMMLGNARSNGEWGVSMTHAAETNVVVLRRVGVAYSLPGGESLSPSGALFKALADAFPEGKPERFRRLGLAFALPKRWDGNEPSASPDGELRSLTEIAATNIVFRCSAVCDAVERRYGEGAGTDAVMIAVRAMTAGPDLNAFVVMAVDGPEPSEQPGAGTPVAAALLLTRAGTPKDEVRVVGAHEVHHWATPLLDRALSLAMGGALKKSGCTIADIERVVISSSASLTREAVDAAARSLCAPSSWGGEVHTQEDFAHPLCAASGAFDLAFEAMLLRYYAKHGQRFLWVSRTADSTCAAVLRQHGGRDDDT